MSVLTDRRGADAADSGTERPRRARRWVAGIMAVAVTAGLVWIVAFGPVLSARSVKVEGIHRLSTAQVVDAARVPIGTPLVRVSRGDIARRVEQLAQVQSARVELSFPSTVVIAVTERVAAAYGLAAQGGGFTYVDATGRTFDHLTAAPTGLPRLSPANNLVDDPATLSAMAQIASVLPADVRDVVKAITASAADDIDLQLRDGRTVVWGASDRNADKIRILPVLLRRPGHVFDVSNPDQVFTH